MKTFSVAGTEIEFVVTTNRFGQWNLSVWVGSRVLMGSAYGNLPMPSDEVLVEKGHALYRRERALEVGERESGVHEVRVKQEVA